MKKLKIGITGGIGGGKSTAADIIREAGYLVVDADQVAKDLMLNDISLKNKITGFFGKDAYLPDGNINKPFLRENIYSDKSKRDKLNSFVHPAAIAETEKIMNEELKKKNLVFVEAAILFETKMDKLFDLILLVLADEEVKIARVMERDNISREQVEKIIESQLSDNTKKGRSDFILMNNGNIDELKKNISFFINLFITLAQTGNFDNLKLDDPYEEEDDES